MAGSAVTAYAQLQQGEAQAAGYEQQAYLKRLQAAESMKASEREAGLSIKRGDQIRDSQASAFGRSGVQVGTGTPMEQMAKTLAEARDESNAILEAGAYRKFTSDYEGAMSLTMAGQARYGAKLSALGSVITGAQSMVTAKGGL